MVTENQVNLTHKNYSTGYWVYECLLADRIWSKGSWDLVVDAGLITVTACCIGINWLPTPKDLISITLFIIHIPCNTARTHYSRRSPAYCIGRPTCNWSRRAMNVCLREWEVKASVRESKRGEWISYRARPACYVQLYLRNSIQHEM